MTLDVPDGCFPSFCTTTLGLGLAASEAAQNCEINRVLTVFGLAGAMNFMPSESAFDGLLAACAVRHMPSARHTALLDPLQRVLRAGGLLAAVSGCAFVENPDLIPAPEMRWRLVPARYPDCDIRYPIFPASALA